MAKMQVEDEKKTVFTRPAASDMVNFAKRVMDPTHLLFINMQTI